MFCGFVDCGCTKTRAATIDKCLVDNEIDIGACITGANEVFGACTDLCEAKEGQ